MNFPFQLPDFNYLRLVGDDEGGSAVPDQELQALRGQIYWQRHHSVSYIIVPVWSRFILDCLIKITKT